MVRQLTSGVSWGAMTGEKLCESTASDVRLLCSTLLNCYLIQVGNPWTDPVLPPDKRYLSRHIMNCFIVMRKMVWCERGLSAKPAVCHEPQSLTQERRETLLTHGPRFPVMCSCWRLAFFMQTPIRATSSELQTAASASWTSGKWRCLLMSTPSSDSFLSAATCR